MFDLQIRLNALKAIAFDFDIVEYPDPPPVEAISVMVKVKSGSFESAYRIMLLNAAAIV